VRRSIMKVASHMWYRTARSNGTPATRSNGEPLDTGIHRIEKGSAATLPA
jgi:hypothetical protein